MKELQTLFASKQNVFLYWFFSHFLIWIAAGNLIFAVRLDTEVVFRLNFSSCPRIYEYLMSDDVTSGGHPQLKIKVSMETARSSHCCSTKHDEEMERIEVSSFLPSEEKESNDGEFISSSVRQHDVADWPQEEISPEVSEIESSSWQRRLPRLMTRFRELFRSFLGVKKGSKWRHFFWFYSNAGLFNILRKTARQEAAG